MAPGLVLATVGLAVIGRNSRHRTLVIVVGLLLFLLLGSYIVLMVSLRGIH